MYSNNFFSQNIIYLYLRYYKPRNFIWKAKFAMQTRTTQKSTKIAKKKMRFLGNFFS